MGLMCRTVNGRVGRTALELGVDSLGLAGDPMIRVETCVRRFAVEACC
jgi:hypothetical protein